MSYDGWRPVRFDDFVPGMKKSNLSILIWTCIYLLNLVLVFVFQGMVYDLPDEQVHDLLNDVLYGGETVESDLFPGCQVLDAYPGMFFLLQDSDGNLEIAVLKQSEVIRDYKIDQTVPVPQGQDVAVNFETEWQKYTMRILDGNRIDWDGTIDEPNGDLGTVFWRSYISGNGLMIYMLIAVVMLLAEYGIYCQIQKLRE